MMSDEGQNVKTYYFSKVVVKGEHSIVLVDILDQLFLYCQLTEIRPYYAFIKPLSSIIPSHEQQSHLSTQDHFPCFPHRKICPHHDTSPRKMIESPSWYVQGCGKGHETRSSQAPASNISPLLFHIALPCLLVYIFVSSDVFANVANAGSFAGYLRYPSRCLVFSATPTVFPGSECLALPGCYWFQLRLGLVQIIGLHLLGDQPSALKMTTAINRDLLSRGPPTVRTRLPSSTTSQVSLCSSTLSAPTQPLSR
jgi:hypothetical protein